MSERPEPGRFAGYDPTDDELAAQAYAIGATVAEIEGCSSHAELVELVCEHLRERSARSAKIRERLEGVRP